MVREAGCPFGCGNRALTSFWVASWLFKLKLD